MTLLNAADDIRLGTQLVDRVYLGNTEVWSATDTTRWQYGFEDGTADSDAPSPVTIGGLGFNAAGWGTLPLVDDSAVSGPLAVRRSEGDNHGILFTTHTRTGNFWLRAEVEVTELLVPISVFIVSKGPCTSGFPDYGGYHDYNRGYTVAAGLAGSGGTFGATPQIFIGAMTHQDNIDILGNDADVGALTVYTLADIPGGWPTGPMRLEFQWAPDTATGLELRCWLDPASTGAPDVSVTSSASWAPYGTGGGLDPWPLSPRIGASTDAVGWAVGARGSDETNLFSQPFLGAGDTLDWGAVGFSSRRWVGPWT
jgi:hypothetical protein